LGIAWAHFFHASAGLHWFLLGASSCLLVGLIFLRAGWDRIAVCCVLAGMAATGVAAARRWEQRFPPNHVRYLGALGVDLNEAVRLRGRVVSSPYRSGYGVQFDVEAQEVESLGRRHAVMGKIRLRVPGAALGDDAESGNPYEFQYGDVIQATVRLRQPHIYQNPGSFDFRRWMEDIEDVYWVGTVKNSHLVAKVGHTAGFHWAEWTEHARRRLLRGIDDLYPPWSAQGRYGSVLKAVLWGDRTALDSGTIEDFRKTGLYHLLVIAGLHVGLLTLLLDFLLRLLRCRRVTRAMIVLGFLGVYALLVEQRAPTLRATLMIALYLLARILGRENSSLNAIGGVALVLLYFRPAWLFESGFQLSFSAALLIVSVAVPILARTTEPYRRALRRLDDVLLDDRLAPRLAQTRLDLRALVRALRRRVPGLDRFPTLARNLVVAPLRVLVWAANMLVFSAVLQLGLLLPMVETFHRVTFAGVGLNALAIPLMTVLLALALPINLLSVVSPAIAAWLAKLLTLVMALLFDMTHLPRLVAWLSYRMPSPPLWVACGFCAAFVFAGWTLRGLRRPADFDGMEAGTTPVRWGMSAALWRSMRSVALVACGVFVALVALHPFPPRVPRGVLRMTVLDCGQGDALFLLFPDGTTLLVNAGGSHRRGAREGAFQGRRWDPGEDIVSPFLWSLGIKKLDVVAITDAREDHFGGVGAILNNFQVGEFWHAPHPETSDYTALLESVAERGIPTRTLMAGDALAIGDSSIRVLWPGNDPIDPAEAAHPVQPGRTSDADQSRSREDSLAMRIGAGGVNCLLLEDVSRNEEKAIAASGAPLEGQVLSVTRHGSSGVVSKDFLARLAPRVMVVSSEASNEGGLADAQALGLPRNLGPRLFATSSDGAVTVEAKDGSITVKTYAGGETR
jgi:competence protein ComEC